MVKASSKRDLFVKKEVRQTQTQFGLNKEKRGLTRQVVRLIESEEQEDGSEKDRNRGKSF